MLFGASVACLCFCGCGDRSVAGGSPQRSAVRKTAESASATTVAFGVAKSLQNLKGDEDDDEGESTTMGTEPNGDADQDTDNDRADSAKNTYYDKDDGPVRAYGHRARPREKRRFESIVGGYYRAAGADDGVAACSLIDPQFVKAIPEDYGKAPGPGYLRGATTCPQVMRRFFRHEHGQLTIPIEVVGVRVGHELTYVLLGSETAPARAMLLRRTGHLWGILGLTASPLP
jgi:hypothetical protein